MPTAKELGERARERILEQVGQVPALLGMVSGSDGSITVRVPGQTNMVYVRLNDQQAQTVQALNISVEERANAPVWVRRTQEGQYVIAGVREAAGTALYGEGAGTVNTPALVGDAKRIVLPGDKFKPGRVRLSRDGGLNVAVEAFHYPGGYFAGQETFSLSAAVAAISGGNHAWVIVGYDTDAQALTAAVGPQVGIPVEIFEADTAAAITSPNTIRLFALDLRSGATAITENTPMVDVRQYFHAPPPYRRVRTVDTDTTLTQADDVVLADASGGAVTVTLESAAEYVGWAFIVKKIDSSGNAVTLTADGAEEIDGSGTLALAAQYDSATIISDGANWHVIAIV